MKWKQVSMDEAFIYAQGRVLMSIDKEIYIPKELEDKVRSLIKFSDDSYILCVSDWDVDHNYNVYTKLPVFYIGIP